VLLYSIDKNDQNISIFRIQLNLESYRISTLVNKHITYGI